MPSLPVFPPGTPWPTVSNAHAAGRLVEIGGDAVEISGLHGGTVSGEPTVALAIKLPDGRVAFAETTWRLFAFAFWRLAADFGERPDLAGMEVETGLVGGGRLKLDVIEDPGDSWVGCAVEGCGARVEIRDYLGPTTGAIRTDEELAAAYSKMLGWLHRHLREEHPDIDPTTYQAGA